MRVQVLLTTPAEFIGMLGNILPGSQGTLRTGALQVLNDNNNPLDKRCFYTLRQDP